MSKKLLFLLLIATCLLIVGSVAMAHSELEEGWNAVSPGGDTICARGGEYQFFARPGSSDNLLIYFQGGGACWNGINCAEGYRFPPDSPSPLFKDSVFPNESASYVSGIFDFANEANPVSDYNIVYVPYCTADVHTGSKTIEYTAGDGSTYTINHTGFVNAQAALEWTYEHFPAPSQIFVTGSSAGAYGAIVHAPYVMNHYAGTRVVVLGDAGIGVTAKGWDGFGNWGTLDNLADFVPAFTVDNIAEVFNTNYMYSSLAAAYPDNFFSEFTHFTDGVQIGFYLLQELELGRQMEPTVAGTAWVTAMRSSLKSLEVKAKNFAYYTAPGGEHTILGRDAIYSTVVQRKPFTEWLSEMLSGSKPKNVLSQ